MASQEGTERKVLRIDDPTAEGNPVPSTRGEVEGQRPPLSVSSAPPNPNDPQNKFADNLKRMKEVQRQDIQELQAAHQAAAAATTAIPEVAAINPTVPVQAPEPSPGQLQSDLSLLVTTGQIREESVVGGYKFVLRTLNARENNEVLSAVAAVNDDLEKLGVLRLSVLARAIETVNGVPLENVPGGDPALTGVRRRESLLELFQLQMVVSLFEKYSTMLERSEAVFNTAIDNEDLLKNS
jgi:hypothetical protein